LRLASLFAHDNPKDRVDIFDIYAASSLRLVGFIRSYFGRVMQGAALAADVALYLVPSPLGCGNAAKNRLKDLIEQQLSKGCQLLVLAHSQGTVIAVDMFLENSIPIMNLVIAGSPIDTLYDRFLGVRFSRPRAVGSWVNYYRPSDFIGGNVSAADRNVVITTDRLLNHSYYWRSQEIVDQASSVAIPGGPQCRKLDGARVNGEDQKI
jgi:hypothetical protein